MIHHLRHNKIDRVQWDALLEQAPNGLIYALSWYLDIVSPGWEALVKEEQGRYVAVMPLPVRRKFGFRYLQQPLFAQQLGVFSLEVPTTEDWEVIGRLLRQLFRVVTRYSFNAANTDVLAGNGVGVPVEAFTTYYLSLQPPYPQLLAGYKRNRRWRLNQARRRDLRIEPSTNIDRMVQIFHENTAPSIYGIIGEAYEYRLLKALYAAATQRHMATMWQAVSAQGEVIAMILLFRFKEQLIYIFNSSTEAGKEAGAISLLLDEVFRTHAGQTLYFDFEAPEVANVAHFYGSFGSVETPFATIAYNRLPWLMKQAKAVRMALVRRLRPRKG
ncbi:GNAT family N-acetyltransferase [Hymenobacter aerilatus]|uniref:GNAT family N-acetyltransferase n=1 Tax=Hymenobacter aerilatus TaxID=2932251 RepID=A0A8T9T0X3_9BACT|nr:GNAT family N-acetyltransferase [Hymenobacter aerilatus]UOR07281.1 GNAT family N-acetyltransferase [Hymenobacter aerilatus]